MPGTVLPSSTMEEIRAPLSVIKKMFADSKSGQSSWDPSLHFRQALDGITDQVPLLNDVERLEQLAPGSLVRFRCMVQNVYNPEWYIAEYDQVEESTGQKIRCCGHFHDTVETLPGYLADISGSSGESNWVSQSLHGPRIAQPEHDTAQTRSKRALDADEADIEEADSTEGTGMECDGDNSAGQKKARAHGGAQRNGHTHGHDNCCKPSLVEGTVVSHAAIIKVYDVEAEATLKVNDLVEFVGILTVDPVLADHVETDVISAALDNTVEAAFNAAGPPPSSVLPRIHVLNFNKLSPGWTPSTQAISPAMRESRVSAACSEAVRTAVVQRLACSLGGDMLAAEYVLLNMLSTIHSRNAGVFVGKLTLAITGFTNAGHGKELAEAVQELLPLVSYLPISTTSLNKRFMAPKKDYNTELLHSGPLQVASGTQMIVDETTLQPGQLNDIGCKNMLAIQTVVTQQEIPFDFAFYNVGFQTDLPIVITAQSKPLLPADCCVKIVPDNQILHSLLQSVHQQGWQQDARLYLSAMRAHKVEIPDDVCALAEAHFVKARQEDAKVHQQELHRWLTLARLLSQSYGESHVTTQRWSQMIDMEARRLASLTA